MTSKFSRKKIGVNRGALKGFSCQHLSVGMGNVLAAKRAKSCHEPSTKQGAWAIWLSRCRCSMSRRVLLHDSGSEDSMKLFQV